MTNQMNRINEKLRHLKGGTFVTTDHPLGCTPVTTKDTGTGITDTEKLYMESYELYPGISVSYNYYLASSFHIHHESFPSVLELNHCNRGRMGWEMKSGLSLYLGTGDMETHMKSSCAESDFSLPLRYYEGITFSFDLEELQKNPPAFLTGYLPQLSELKEKYCSNESTTGFTASNEIDALFSMLYNLPEDYIIPYCKIKCQEILLRLFLMSPPDKKQLSPLSSAQTALINEIHELLTNNLKERHTIEDLSKKYLINTTSLKDAFKSVYGTPIAPYMKEYRLEYAARLLETTELSIAGIADSVGYDNQSKFTSAFKNSFGLLPTAYRKNRT